jgi:hypothetical protein
MSSTDPPKQPGKTNPTPPVNCSPRVTLDAQAAVCALDTGDEEGLVAVLMTTKWGRIDYQAQVTIEHALGPGTDALYEWAFIEDGGGRRYSEFQQWKSSLQEKEDKRGQ